MKGFIHTLEAVIASTLILTMVLVVLPQTSQQADIEFDSVLQELKTLEQRDKLPLDPSLVKNKIDSTIPESYNHSVRIIQMNSTYRSLQSPDQTYFSSSNLSGMQLWVKNADNLNASFGDSKVLDNISKDGYHFESVDSGQRWFNITGTGKLTVSFNSYISKGNLPEKDDVYTVNYPGYENSSYEIRAAIYK